MTLDLRIDNMFLDRHGLERKWLEELGSRRFANVHQGVREQRMAGLLGFYDLPDGGDLVGEILRFAEGAGQAFENVVVLGMGGSALGTTAMR